MSPHSKSAAAPHAEPVRAGSLYRLAIVGAGTLKGKEIAEVLSDRNFPSLDVKLLDDDESLGQLETVRDEVTFIQSVRSEQFHNIDFTFFASDAECTEKNWQTAHNAGSSIVDLSYAIEDHPEALVRSPWVERQLGRMLAPVLQPGPSVVAHPAAVVLAVLCLRLQKAGPVKRVVATVFEPASEHGQKGMDELHEQTVNLLSFQQLPKTVFDTQVAFNMVSRYGEQSVPPLAAVERRIMKHYQRIAGSDAPALTAAGAGAHISRLRFAVRVEMEDAADFEGSSQALVGPHVTIAAGGGPQQRQRRRPGRYPGSHRPDGSGGNGFGSSPPPITFASRHPRRRVRRRDGRPRPRGKMQ